jgi:hypothetical protein
MGELLLIVLLFADDLLLLADNLAELQYFLNVLSDFCDEVALAVNVPKSKIVVFNAPGGLSAIVPATYRGQPLAVVEQFRYLGVTFHWRQGVRATVPMLKSSAVRAVSALRQRCISAKLHQPAVLFRLFDALVMPILTFGSEIWGTWFGSLSNCLDSPLDKVHTSFIRASFKLRSTTPLLMLYREFGRCPLALHWWARVFKFLQRLNSLDDSRVLRHAYLDCQALFLTGAPCWLSRVVVLCQGLGLPGFLGDPASCLQTIRGLSRLSATLSLRVHWVNLWSTAMGDSTKMSFYLSHMMDPMLPLTRHHWFHPAMHVSTPMSMALHVGLIRFRLGNHDLRVETCRWARNEQARLDLRCRCCTSGLAEDEHHFLFVCPAFNSIRLAAPFGELLADCGPTPTLSILFSQQQFPVLALFLRNMLMHRASILLPQ